MKEILGDLWDYYRAGKWVVITVNGSIRKDGACVMGRGVALQAKEKLPNLPFYLGEFIKEFGNHVALLPQYSLITFPVKHNWWEKADLQLIEQSCKEIVEIADVLKPLFYLPRVGCGNGGLDWKEVKPILEKYLDDRFVIVEKNDGS